MAIRIQLRRDTAANWVLSNPVLRAGELGIETDTLKFKIGNGSSTWTQITNYANITSTGLSNSLSDYILLADQGTPSGPAELNAQGDLVIPENSIILWNDADYDYTTTLTATQPTADRTITFPNVTGNVVTTGDTGSVTNAMLAGSIANDKLSNSAITINGTSTSLGGSRTLGSDDISEGATNKYFTDERAQDATALALAAGTHTNITVTYDDNANSISLAAAPGYTDEEARDAIAAALAAGTHTNITVAYDDNANSISLTGAQTYSDENAQDAVGNAVGNGLDYDDTTGAISVDPSEFALNAVGSPTADVNMASYKITSLAAPTSANDAATKAYVDNTTAGLNFHAAVHAATTANLDATYNNGTSGVGATLTANANEALVIDGHTLNADERVLVKNQTAGLQNGIYVVTATGDGSNPWVLTRATDADNSPAGEIAYGDFCFVQSGSTNVGYGFIVNTTGTITIGTTAISYVQFNAGQVVVAGNGLTETTPGTLAINTAVTVDLNTAQTLTNKTITGTFTGNLTGNVTGDVSGNAGTVTNGVYTNAANTITAASDSTKPLIIKGAASQTANLQEWQTSTGQVNANIGSTGAFYNYIGMFADNTNSGITSLTATTAYANVKPLVVKGAASQTANLQEWQNSAGTVLTKVQSNGVIDTSQYLNMSTSGNAGIAVGGLYRIRMTGNNTQIEASVGNVATLIVKSAASQTADIQQWQNSSGTVLMAVNSSGAISTGTWNGTAIGATYGGTGLTSYATGDIVYASASNTLSKLSAGTDGYLLTLASGVPTWAAAPISLPTQTNNAGKYLTTDGTTASWATLVVPIETGTATLTANTATTISTTALSAFTSIEYMVSLKQGSKVRTSKVVVQTDGTSVDMTEFAITETGGQMTGVVISATTSGSDAVLQATVTDAATTNVDVKFSKVKL
jgi:hypothetical protein